MKLPLEGLLDTGLKLIDKIIPDPAERDRAKLALMQAQQNGDLEMLRVEQAPLFAQVDLNKIEAASGSLFIGGWRPAVGWICAGAVAWHFVLADLFSFMLSTAGFTIPAMPELDIQELLGLLMAMLGIGTMRTAEKFKGVAAK